MSRELMFPLLLECCRPHPDPREIRRLAGLCPWGSLGAEASKYGVAPLVFWALNDACPDAVPPETLAKLRREFQENTRRNLIFANELLRVLEALQQSGIQAAVLKGPALAWTVYESPGMRRMSDIDLLIAEEQVERTEELLVSNGFRRRDSNADIRFFANAGELAFARGNPPLTVDLQWRLGPASFSDLDPEGFRARLQKIEIAGQQALTFCPEDLLIYLCMHGSAHGWSSLKWVCDVARVIDAFHLDWEEILSRSAAAGASRMLSLGLDLAHDLLGAELPQDILKRAADSRTVALASLVRERLRTQHAPSIYAEQALGFQLVEGAGRKWRFLWRRLMPTYYDWDFFRIPPQFFEVYYLARPLRLAWRLLRRQPV